MIIELTRTQFDSLVVLVRQAHRTLRALGVPLEIDNGDQKIEIDSESVEITLED